MVDRGALAGGPALTGRQHQGIFQLYLICKYRNMNELRSLITALLIILAILGFSFLVILLRDNFDIFQVKLITIVLLTLVGHLTYNTAKKL
jgi:hypothetical protein